MPDRRAPSACTRRRASSTLLGLAAASMLRHAAAQERLPEIDLSASDTHPVLVDGSRWRATYIDFWASWCAPCRLSFPWMNDMHDQLSARGLRIVAVNLDRRANDAERFLQQLPARFAVALDPQAQSARRFDVQGMPSSYLVDNERRLLLAHRGFRLTDRAELERQMRAALA